MNISTLEAYVAQQNSWNAIFNGEQYTLLTAEGRQKIAQRLDTDLSPENLTCDGELPRAEVNRRYRELMTAAKQLKKLDPAVTFYEYESEIA